MTVSIFPNLGDSPKPREPGDGEDVMEMMHDQFCVAFTEDLGILEAQQRNIERDPDAPTVDIHADAGGLEAVRIIARLLEAEAGSTAAT